MHTRSTEPSQSLSLATQSAGAIDNGDYYSQASTSSTPIAEPSGSPTIPGYRITGEIARGGMGCVWAAFDLIFEREVAIKTLLPQANAERFITEAQITARIPHPNIPPVHALGTLDDGSPYLVMKLIRGRTLADLLKERASPREDVSRFVGIFEQIAQGVGFAHSQGIIHRDLKPANVMVGAFGEVQVMDWGLAKDLASRGLADAGKAEARDTADEVKGATRIGTVMGTPGYMAPEQARGEVVDARADVFALGSILTLILTGRPAFVGESAASVIEKTARADLAEAQERLSACGAEAELIALARQCLSAEASARPADARVVASAVASYRASVAAKLRQAETERAEAAVRATEAVKRRRLLQRALGGIAAVLLIGMIGTTWGMWRAEEAASLERSARAEAERQRRTAEAQRIEAEAAEEETYRAFEKLTNKESLRFLTELKELSASQRQFLLDAAGFFRRATAKAGVEEKGRSRAARGYFALGSMLDTLKEVNQAADAYRQSVTIWESLVRDHPNVPDYRSELAASHNNLGTVLSALGEKAEAVRAYRQSLTIFESLVRDFPNVSDYRRDLALSHNNLGSVLHALGQNAAAVQAVRQSLTIREALVRDFPNVPDYRRDLALTHNNLGTVLRALGQNEAAVQAARNSLTINESLVRDFPDVSDYRRDLAASQSNLGVVLRALGQHAEAVQAHRQSLTIKESLVRDFPNVPDYRRDLASSHNNLGTVLRALGQNAEAVRAVRQSLTIQESLVRDFPNVPDYRSDLALTYYNLGNLLSDLSQTAAAVQAYRQSLTIYESLVRDFPDVPEYRRDLARSHNNLGTELRNLGETAAAVQAYRQSLTIRESLVRNFPDVPNYRHDLALNHYNLGNTFRDLRETGAAVQAYRQSLTIFESLVRDFPNVPDYRRESAMSHNNLGTVLRALGEKAESLQAYRQSLTIREALVRDFPNVPDYRRDLAGSYVNLGHLVSDQGKPREALGWFAKSIPLLEANLRQEPRDATSRLFLRNSFWGQAKAYDRLGRFADAATAWERAGNFNDDPKAKSFFAQQRRRAEILQTLLGSPAWSFMWSRPL